MFLGSFCPQPWLSQDEESWAPLGPHLRGPPRLPPKWKMIIRAINLPEGSETPFFAAFPRDYSGRTPLLAPDYSGCTGLGAGAIQHSQSQLSHASLLVQPYHRPISIYNPYPSPARFNFGHNLLFIRDTLNLWQQRLTKVSFDNVWSSTLLNFWHSCFWVVFTESGSRLISGKATDSISGQGGTKYVETAANL